MQDKFRFIRDSELKYIGNSKKQKYMFALFECPYCHQIIETRKTIGRYLKDDEVVHHINKIKTDNREENLQVMTKSEHMKMHQKEKK